MTDQTKRNSVGVDADDRRAHADAELATAVALVEREFGGVVVWSGRRGEHPSETAQATQLRSVALSPPSTPVP